MSLSLGRTGFSPKVFLAAFPRRNSQVIKERFSKLKKTNIILCVFILTFFLLLSACNQSSDVSKNESLAQTGSEPVASDTISETVVETKLRATPTPTPAKIFSPELLPEERSSITLGKLSPEHEFYGEVTSLDPECADYIQELSIYDAEIDDTFIVHISLPPDYDEGQKYSLVLLTDGIWRLSDHSGLRPMMVAGEIRPVILVSVGYPNGYDYLTIRERDLVDDPESYLHFIVDNLVPYLSEIFPVDSQDMTIAGHSYGGYWTFYALFHNDTIGKNTFQNFYIGSPSFQASTNFLYIEDFAEEYFERNSTLNNNVYVCVGDDEPGAFKLPITGFVDELNARDDTELHLKYEIIEGYGHNTVFKPTIRTALLMFYGDTEPAALPD